MRPLFIFATQLEAKAFLESLDFSKVHSNLWQSRFCHLLICGMGSLQASHQLTKTLHEIPRPTHLVNMGCAASLSEFKTFDCLRVSKVSKSLDRTEIDKHSQLFFDHLFPSIEITSSCDTWKLPTATLTTVDCPVHNVEMRSKLSFFGQLLDMEGYGLAYVAKEAEIPLEMIKCISDHAKDGGEQSLRDNIGSCSKKLSSIALSWLQLL